MSKVINLSGMLFVLFLSLKLAGMIHWSWWWVFAPFWVPLVAVVVFLGICALGYAMVEMCRK